MHILGGFSVHKGRDRFANLGERVWQGEDNPSIQEKMEVCKSKHELFREK